jgi:ABC-type multidrug transport system fused ATPase/permease subunit
MAEIGDARHLLRVFSRYSERPGRSLASISGLSFLGGMSEAVVLVLISTVAISTTGTSETVVLGPVELSQRGALLSGFALLVLNALVSVALGWVVATTTTQASLSARQSLLEAFHDASYQRKSQDRAATLQEALTTYVDRFSNSLMILTTLITGALNVASFGIAAIVVSPSAALALVIIGLLLVVVLRPANRRMRGANQALSRQRRAYAEGATESVLLARELSVFGASGIAGQRLRDLDKTVAREFWRSKFLTRVTPKVYQTLVFALAVSGLFIVLGQDEPDLAAIGAVVILVIRSLSYGQQVLIAYQALAESRPFVDRFVGMLESYTHESRAVGHTAVGAMEQIRFRGAGFAYGDGAVALAGLDGTIAAGETIGVVGPSGAGKSTLVNLLLRLYEPTTGDILVNGVPLKEVLDGEWHQRTAIVPQEPRLIHGTIADNIRFFRDLDDADVQQAAVEAHIDGFIRTLPGGYESPVGELGMGLSGGQRQRICIARALAGQPDLLVLDEPTSALDGESEAAIQRTLEELKGRVTMVIAAHRLSTLSICDRLWVLEDGRLVASGTAPELAETSPYYREAMRLAGL